MTILTIKTDTYFCELSLYDGDKKLGEKAWEAGRQLAIQIPGAIEDFLISNQKEWDSLEGIVVFQGPGSFTGLRIGITVANTIAYAQDIPVIGVKGEDWIQNGLVKIKSGKNNKIVLPDYGSQPHITKPKK